MTETFKSIRQLAKAIGKSHVAVSKWVKHPEWRFSRTSPWSAADVASMRQWAIDHLANDHFARPTPLPKLSGEVQAECDVLVRRIAVVETMIARNEAFSSEAMIAACEKIPFTHKRPPIF